MLGPDEPQIARAEPALPPLVGRLAPSPSGELHLGHARSFLLAWWQARSLGGQVRLRFEDLDGARCEPRFIDQARRDLQWLGLDWDGPLRIQSEHKAAIIAAAQDLLQRGLAYPCVCTRGEIQALSAPHGPDAEPRYPGTCRGRYTSLEDARSKTGKQAGIRYLAPDEPVAFNDGCLGPQALNVQQSAGDFLIVRRDGSPAYQLSVVVDDDAQGVTSIVRGCDLVSSTPRQLCLITALGLRRPSYWHVSLVVDAAGKRLAKRDHDLSLHELQTSGVDPRSIVAWAARSCGFSVPKRVHASEVIAQFDLLRVPNTPVAIGHDTVRSWLAG
jgi:glutamyl-tRNA synthetase